MSSGMLFAWSSPTIPILMKDSTFNITIEQASYFTVLTSLSMGISALIYPKAINTIGLKKTILIISFMDLLSWILIAFSRRIEIFYFARIIAGIGDAGMFGAVPIYVCEIAEVTVRDVWSNAVPFNLFIGIFVINVIGSYCSITTTALICATVPVMHIIIFSFAPESPYLLLGRSRKQQAKRCLQQLRWREDVDEELEQMELDVKRQVSESGTIKDLFTVVSNRKAFVMCLCLRTTQQFSGLTAFETYTQYLFEQVGGEISEITSSIIFSGVLMLSVLLFSLISHMFKRKYLLLFSYFGCVLSLGIESLYLALNRYTAIDLSSVSWISLLCLLGFIVCEGGLGVTPMIMVGEMFPASVKNKAVFLINLCFSIHVLIVPKLFQILTSNFGILYAFLFFAICCFAGGIFCCFYIIETKGKTLEEIQQILKASSDVK